MAKAKTSLSLDNTALVTTPPLVPELFWRQAWGPALYGCTQIINPTVEQLGALLEAPIWTIDVETNGKDGTDCKIVGVGICADAQTLYWLRDLNGASWGRIVARFETVGIQGQNVRGDLDWLRGIGVNVTDSQIVWDTMIASYAEDPAKSSHGLKQLCASELGIEWPKLKDEMLTRKVGIKTNKKGEVVDVLETYDLEEIYQQHPQEVIDYNHMDLYGTQMLAEKQRTCLTGERRVYHDKYELPFSHVVSAMEKRGIRVDRSGLQSLLATKSIEMKQKLESLKDRVKNAAFNPGSWQQVLAVLKEHGHKVTKTDEETIRPLAKKDPFIDELLTYRGLVKLIGTYIEPLLAHSANKEERVYTHFNQTVTATGRLSSSKPMNFQNQPPEVKPFFIPAEGHTFICADYSQIDLRSLGHLSMEPVYVNAFMKGRKHKVHQDVADLWRVEYKLGKIISLALAYNGGPGRLMQEAQGWGVDIPYFRAKQFSDEFISKLSVLTAWKREQYAKTKELGYITTLLGRRISMPYPQRADYATEREYEYGIHQWENRVIAYQGQGGTGDIVKVGMLNVDAKGIPLLAQVHDEVLLEVRADEADDLLPVVQQALESAATLRVPLYCDIKKGDTWASAKP